MSKKQEKKDSSGLQWFIIVFITTFILSITFSYISTNGVSNLGILPAIAILIVVILVGILFDIIGVAVQVANEHEFHAKATKKVEGSKTSIKLIKNSAKVANICADVIGDICGVLSGSVSVLITIKIGESYHLGFDLQFIISAVVASLTVGGKAIGKGIAQDNSTRIVHFVGTVLNKFRKQESGVTNKKKQEEKKELIEKN